MLEPNECSFIANLLELIQFCINSFQWIQDIDGPDQDYNTSIANALELSQFCIKSSLYI